jgi:hypothetical protein
MPTNSLKPSSRFILRLTFFFMAAIIIQLLFLAILPAQWRANESADFDLFYYPVAKNIVAGDGYTLHSRFTTTYPPLNSIFLAAIVLLSRVSGISDLVLLKVYSILCSAIIALLLYETSLLAFPKKYALFAPIVLLTFPFYLWLAKQPNSEQIFMVFLFGGLYLLVRSLCKGFRSRFVFFVAGFLFGISSLARPIGIGIGIFFAIYLAIYWLITKKKLDILIPLALIAGNILAVFPWEAYVFYQTGKIIPISSLGKPAMVYSVTFASSDRDPTNEYNLPPNVKSLMDRLVARTEGLQTRKTIGQVGLILFDEFVHDPLSSAQLIFTKLYRALYATDSRRFDSLGKLIQIPYLLLLGFCFWLGLKKERYRLLASVAILVFIYFWGMTMLGLPILRYMMPAICFCFVLSPMLIISLQALYNRYVSVRLSSPFSADQADASSDLPAK